MNKKKVLYLTQASIIVVLYVLLTQLSNIFGLASSLIQVRFSESLCILSVFTPAAVPGLAIGCLLSNLLTGCALPDIFFGSLATLLGALGTRSFHKLIRRKSGWLFPALLPPILSNTLIIPFVLKYAYGFGPIWLSFITVSVGEVISCGILGSILFFSVRKPMLKIWPD